MAIKIEMPKLSDTMEEGVISKWNVSEGDSVEAGDIIAEVDTDKATMDVEVFDGGKILKILAQAGDAVPLGGTMAIIGEEGEDISALLEGAEAAPAAAEAAAPKEEAKAESTESFDPVFGDLDKDTAPATTPNGDGRLKASPLAKKIAEDKGIDLSSVSGSGPEGRIVKKDVEGAHADPAASKETQMVPVKSFDSIASEEVKVSQMRKVIARRLSESKFTNPHFYETIDIDMKNAFAARKAMNEANPDVRISFNDIIVKACAIALTRHQAVNSSWNGDTIIHHGDVNIAFAVAVPDGLMTPVINHADKKGLAHISAETKELAGLARDRRLTPDQMEGSTFTISNLGMFGIEEFTAIINPPNAAILAVGSIREIPVVENGEIVIGQRMKVTLSSDHRTVDGATAAQFLNTVRNLLQNPLEMLL